MLKKFFTRLYHFSWYVFAFVVLTGAVLTTLVRLALPEIGGYKIEIQSWVSEYMDYPVVIDEINAEWQGWVPHLYLKNIDLYTVDNSTLITQFNSAHLVGIDLLASIKRRGLVPSHLSISGIDLKLTRNTDGSISINKDKNNNINAHSNNNAALSGWLLKQKHIVLENANLIWHDKKESKEQLKFSNVRLELKTQEQRVQVEAYIPFPKQHGQSLTIKMDVTGNILTPDWNGSVYIEVKEINPINLLEDFAIKSIGDSANIKLWTNWNKSKLIDISGEMQYSNFSLNTDQYSLAINNIEMNLYGERKKDKNWLLNISIEDVKTSNGLWPASNYQFKLEKDEYENNYRYSGYLSYLKLEETLPFIIANNIVPEDVLNKINWQSIKGELTNTSFDFNPASKTEDIIQFNTTFKNLALISNDKKNYIYGLEGNLTATDKVAKIKLNSKDPAINFTSLFDKPYLLSAIDAEFELINNDSFELKIKNLHIEDKFISVHSSGKITFNEDSPFIDVVAHMDETGIEHLPAYLPKQTPPTLSNWFKQALVGGQLLYADLIFRGSLANFPFKNSDGMFKAILDVDNATFNYAKDWPPIDNVNAEVIIDNNDLYASSSSAYIFDATIDGFTANIKNMEQKKTHIIVNGTVDGHTSDAANFITQSPLKKNISLRELTENIYGKLNMKLDLDIPLGFSGTSVGGVISFSNTTIESNLPGSGIEAVNGDISFKNSNIWGEDIDALYQGKPVKLNIPKLDEDDSHYQQYIISGMADENFIINQLATFFPSFYSTGNNINNSIRKNFSGKNTWSLTLSKPRSDKKTTYREVEFNSDLKGIAINLPSPPGKTAEERLPLSIKTNLTDLLFDEININYGNFFFADIKVDNTEDFIVKNILIGLGHPHPEVTTSNNISIQGELERLNVSEWTDFINLEKLSSSKNLNSSKIISGNIQIQKLIMMGSEFNNVHINLTVPNNSWQVLFDGEEIKGQTNFIKADNSRLRADFERLALKGSGDDDKEKIKAAIEKIPELEVNISEFTYDGNKLGQLNLLTSNIENGINIDNLSITKPDFSIKAQGTWMRIDNVDRSDFHATLEADSIETMLSTFNFNSSNINEGQTRIEMNANWMDTPINFSLKEIEGELDMKIGKGQFLNIDPSAGRLFGLLSLQTLPRRLTLDFADLFEEGLAFDKIDGSFSLQQGQAYTNNLKMSGPAANIVISGRTGLTTEDYDQIATVTPKMSSNIPVASALFGSVGIGVAAAIYIAGEIFKFIPKKIDSILSRQYSITGSWDNPSIEKIEEEKDSG